MRRTARLVSALAGVMVAIVVAAGVFYLRGSHPTAAATGQQPSSSLATVEKRSLSSRVSVNGTLGYLGAYQVVKSAKTFALNMLGKDHKGLAFTFFKPVQASDGKISGQAYRKGSTGAPLLDVAPGAVECKVTSIVEQGDHHIVVGEVVEAHLNKPPAGRPDAAILEMKDLGDNVFYGG